MWSRGKRVLQSFLMQIFTDCLIAAASDFPLHRKTWMRMLIDSSQTSSNEPHTNQTEIVFRQIAAFLYRNVFQNTILVWEQCPGDLTGGGITFLLSYSIRLYHLFVSQTKWVWNPEEWALTTVGLCVNEWGQPLWGELNPLPVLLCSWTVWQWEASSSLLWAPQPVECFISGIRQNWPTTCFWAEFRVFTHANKAEMLVTGTNDPLQFRVIFLCKGVRTVFSLDCKYLTSLKE